MAGHHGEEQDAQIKLQQQLPTDLCTMGDFQYTAATPRPTATSVAFAVEERL